MRRSLIICWVFLTLFSGFLAADDGSVPPPRIYPDRFDPAEHPERARFCVTPPDWATFDGKTQFIALRSFPSKDGVGFDFAKSIEQYQNAELGRVVWPHAATIFFKNLGELADEIKNRDLYLFDIWGYVPGSGPINSGDWTQFRADPAQFRILEEKLGARWLGMDNGEQDGRYIGGYAPYADPVSDDRFEQYLRFQRHFEKMGDDLGNRLATLVSLNFGHYFLKEGIYTLIGAETAQALPNSQVYYSWIRGAGKQYGVLWFGNASVYNRWGWKAYPGQETKGTSLSLMKRLMYSHMLYNSAAVGFEAGWFVGGELGPIGKIQQSASRWLDENGDPGTMTTPVALLCDFQCGWSFPRHLYTDNTYRVWGNIPYSAGDYLTNDLFELIYPRYQDSSYYHDETGFLTATPFGDSADALLTDAPQWLLDRYSLILAADEFSGSVELADNLSAYVRRGGRLVMTAGNLARFDGGLCDATTNGSPKTFEAGTKIQWNDGTETVEEQAFEAFSLVLPKNATILARSGDFVLAAEVPFGEGTLTLLASPFGLPTDRVVDAPVANPTDQPLSNPYPLLSFARKTVESELNRTVLFDVGDGLGSIVCRKGDGVYTVGVFNNSLGELPFEIKSRFGKIDQIRELPTDESERSAIGFLPEGFENSELGTNSETTIAGSSVRIFEVRLSDDRVVPMERPAIPEAPQGRLLALRGQTPIKEAILARPTFFQHWNGILVDWKYLNARSADEIEREAGWIRRQKLQIAVDFSSGVDLYPDLRLIKNDLPEYEQSMATFRSVVEKAAALGAKEILLTSHRTPENNYSSEQTRNDSVAALKELCAFAAEREMTISMRIETNSPISSPSAALDFAKKVEAENFRLAPSLCVLQKANEDPAAWDALKSKISRVLVAGWELDANNDSVWTNHSPLSRLSDDAWNSIFVDSKTPVIFDAVYKNSDEEYLDAKRWESR